MTRAIHRWLRLIAWKAIHAMPRRDIIVDTENGVLAVDNRDWLIGKKLYVNREFESAEMDSAVAGLRAAGWLPPGRSTLIDAGANIGMISVAMLLRGYFQRAIAFEPTPSTYRLLVDNVQRNALQGAIRCIPLALSASETGLELSLSPDNSGDNRIERAGVGGGAYREERRNRTQVSATRLTTWLAANGVEAEQIGLIWLDVQGHEVYALTGAGELLREVPVVTEIWPYALERSGLGVASFLQLAAKYFEGFWTLPPSSIPAPLNRLGGLMEAVGRSPRGMTQVVLLPRQVGPASGIRRRLDPGSM